MTEDAGLATSLGLPVAGPEAISTAAGRELRAVMARRPLVVTGVPAAPLDASSLRSSAALLAGAADAVLSGDTGSARAHLPPSYRARLLRDAGLRPWLTLTGRDRNRVAIEGELAALADSGAAGVLCVTGDHPRLGARPDAAAVFELSSLDVVPLARELGLLTAVAESPDEEPVGSRPDRLVAKERAGAQICMPQYVPSAAALAGFIGAVRGRGGAIPFLAGVPLVIDAHGGRVLTSWAGALLPEGYVEGVLDAADPELAGVRAAVALAADLLAVDGVAGVVVAGASAPGSEERTAGLLATVARELGGGA